MPERRTVEGWLFDIQEETQGVGLWIVDERGKTSKLLHPFRPYFYVTGDRRGIEAALRSIHAWKTPVFLSWNERKEFYSDKVISCLKVSVNSPPAYQKIVKALLSRQEKGFELYTCDIRTDQLFFMETGLFPLARVSLEVEDGVITSVSLLDSPWDMDYSLPPLSLMELEMEGGHGNPAHRRMGRLQVKVDGEELIIDDDPLSSLKKLLTRHDPHVILTRWGDSYLIPNLQSLALSTAQPLPFGREPSKSAPKHKGRSYFTYGKIVFTASSYAFKGRWHLDLENSFTIKECGLEGLIELARLSRIPVQRMARTSTGTAISAMQVARAIKDGYLIPFRKHQAEDFKTADELLVTDKGGLTYRPVPGFYENVAELDFSSMYPTLMEKFNLSPETVNCACCHHTPVVPEAGYRICSKRTGLIPKTVGPLLLKRQRYKEKIRVTEDPALKEIYDRRQSAHKWCLVTCFGYLGYKNARFGKIEAHESTTAWGREMLLRAKECAEERGYAFIHGLTDSLWLKKQAAKKNDYLQLAELIEKETGIPLALEGVYRWISFLPSRRNRKIGVPARFVGAFDNGKLKVRGLMARKHDTPPFVKRAQQSMLEILSAAVSRNEYRDLLETKIRCIAEASMERLMNGRMAPEELSILKRLSRDPLHYEHGTMTAAVSQELVARGIKLMPGEAVQMVITDSKAKEPSLKVRALGFLDLPHTYDREKYREIFLEAIREVDLDRALEDMIRGGRVG